MGKITLLESDLPIEYLFVNLYFDIYIGWKFGEAKVGILLELWLSFFNVNLYFDIYIGWKFGEAKVGILLELWLSFFSKWASIYLKSFSHLLKTCLSFNCCCS